MCESTIAISSITTPTPSPIVKTVRHLPKSISAPNGISRANSESDTEVGECIRLATKKIKITRTKKDKSSGELCIFKMSDYDKICDSLSSSHLKLLCTSYGLKCTGTKSVMANRARTHCIESHFSYKIQRVYRAHLARMYVRKHLVLPHCSMSTDFVNDTDFYTMDDFSEVPHYQMFAFKDDVDNKLYRFNIASFFKLVKGVFTSDEMRKAVKELSCDVPAGMTNPYTRTPITLSTIKKFFNKLRMCRLMRYPVYTEFMEEEMTPQQAIDARIVDVFQDINKLGNYADSDWFSSLKHPQYIWFIQELYDIWAYRAELSTQVKMQICPPYGQIFPSVTNGILIIHEMRTASFQRVREVCISTCERMVRSGLTPDDRYLGASYVLSALTLVSPRARTALPWLYQSVAAGSPTAAAGVGLVYMTTSSPAPRTASAPVTEEISLPIPAAAATTEPVSGSAFANYTTYNNILNSYLINNVIHNAATIYNDEIDDTILYNILTAMNTTNSVFRPANTVNNATANTNTTMNINSAENEYDYTDTENELE
jgi:hypothetical protein